MWLYKKNGVAEGPLDSLAVEDMIRTGTITRETLVFTQGMATWLAAEKSALAQLFRKLPPPVPLPVPARHVPPAVPYGLVPSVLPPPQPPLDMPKIAPGRPVVNRALAKTRPEPTATAPTGWAFKDPLSLTHTLTTLLIVLAGMHLIGVVAGLISLDQETPTPHFQPGTGAAAWNFESLRLVPGGVHSLVLIATTIVFGCWILRMARNVRALGARNLRFSPGLAVGAYFIPLGNLFLPFLAMKEIYNASRNPLQANRKAGSPLLTFWWSLWILSSIAGNLFTQDGYKPPVAASVGGFNLVIDPVAWYYPMITANGLDAHRALVAAQFLSDVAHSLLCVSAIALVESVCARQRAAVRRLRAA